jgi:hypothetical protein
MSHRDLDRFAIKPFSELDGVADGFVGLAGKTEDEVAMDDQAREIRCDCFSLESLAQVLHVRRSETVCGIASGSSPWCAVHRPREWRGGACG